MEGARNVQLTPRGRSVLPSDPDGLDLRSCSDGEVVGDGSRAAISITDSDSDPTPLRRLLRRRSGRSQRR